MSWRLVPVFVLLLLVGLAWTDEETAADALRPCYDCDMFNIMQSDKPQPQPQVSLQFAGETIGTRPLDTNVILARDCVFKATLCVRFYLSI